MYALCRLGFCKRFEIVLPSISSLSPLQAVTGDTQNRQYAGALDEVLSAEGEGPKKLVLVVDRIDVLGKHADGRKVMKLTLPQLYIPVYSVLCIQQEHPSNSAMLGSRL